MRSGASLKCKLNKTCLMERIKTRKCEKPLLLIGNCSDQCKLHIFGKQLVFSDDVSSDVNKGRPSGKYS